MPISLTRRFNESMIIDDISTSPSSPLSLRSSLSPISIKSSLSQESSLYPMSSLSPPSLARLPLSPKVHSISPIIHPRSAPHIHYLQPYQQYQHQHAELKVFNEIVEWHQKNATNGNPIPINMLFIMSLIDPIHKLYKRDNNSIINWCFRDIYLATFGTSPLPLSVTDINNMYINFYNSIIYK